VASSSTRIFPWSPGSCWVGFSCMRERPRSLTLGGSRLPYAPTGSVCPSGSATLSAYALPPFEVLLGLYLLVGLFIRASAWTTNGMMILFIVALTQGALRGLEIDCGCFGSASGVEASSLWVDLVRDLGLLALGLQLAFAPPGKFSLDARLCRNKA
jgi:uncharacterized membrane protein YphA (DoxX/SURF4 family)